MATLEAATVELQNLNGTSDIQLEAMFDQYDAISVLSTSVDQTNIILVDILEVMKSFIAAVPKEISEGYDKLIDFEKTQEVLEGRGATGGDDDDADGDDSNGKGFFKSNFDKGMKKDLKFVDAIKDSIAEVILVAGSVAGTISSALGFVAKALSGFGGLIGKLIRVFGGKLLTGLRLLAGLVTAPIAMVIAAVAGLALGITGFIEDFQSEEGTFMDKLIAGLGGFVKGVMKLVTVPLDLLKGAISWVAGALGFEEFEKMLDGFSFTEGFAEVVDIAVDFIQSIKDWIANKVKSLVNGVGEFFGLDPIFEDKPEAVSGANTNAEDTKSKSSREEYSEESSSKRLSSSEDVIENESLAVSTAAGEPVAAKVTEAKAEGSSKKVKIPEGVRVTFFGQYSSYNKETNSQAFFSNVKDAVTFLNAPIEEAAKMDTSGYAAQIYEERKKFESRPKRVLKSKSKSGETQSPILNAVSAPQSLVVGEPVSANVERSPGMIVGAGERIALSNSVAIENNKLEEKKAEMNQSGSSNAVISSDNNSTNISSSTHNHGMPSATDKSDRTDRRGSFRGA